MSEWFNKNYIVLNPDNSHYLILRFNDPFRDFLSTIVPHFAVKIVYFPPWLLSKSIGYVVTFCGSYFQCIPH